ncbi:hypothetical protein WKI65_33045 [Streptomyces sp. MS1.AVA.3]|uniref:hypothetical protein n=1 Tax=Streptomyces decoyicus TaxID=249567 RepID=UPI0030BF1340
MAWVRISDDFYDHAKFDAAGALGTALWVAGLAWCNRNLTDGLIPRRVALRLLDFEDAAEAVQHAEHHAGGNGVTDASDHEDLGPLLARFATRRLVAAGLWAEADGGYRVHDYLDYQKSADQIGSERKSNAARQKAFRERKQPAKPASSATGVAQGHAGGNAVTDCGVTPAPNPNPPTSPDGEVGKQRAGARTQPRIEGAPSEAVPAKAVPLVDACTAAGLVVAWRLTSAEWLKIEALIDRVGIPALVEHARRLHASRGTPAHSARAWIKDWAGLPTGASAAPSPPDQAGRGGGEVVPLRRPLPSYTDNLVAGLALLEERGN